MTVETLTVTALRNFSFWKQFWNLDCVSHLLLCLAEARPWVWAPRSANVSVGCCEYLAGRVVGVSFQGRGLYCQPQCQLFHVFLYQNIVFLSTENTNQTNKIIIYKNKILQYKLLYLQVYVLSAFFGHCTQRSREWRTTDFIIKVPTGRLGN